MTLLTRKAEVVAEPDFRQVGRTGVFIAYTEANHADSMTILVQHGLRSLSYQEAFVTLYRNPKVKNQLQGSRFYLYGRNASLMGYYSFNEEGELNRDLERVDGERGVHVWQGSQPLALRVSSEKYLPDRTRYIIFGGDGPSKLATAVVGVRANHRIRLGNKTTAHQIENTDSPNRKILAMVVINLIRYGKEDRAAEMLSRFNISSSELAEGIRRLKR